MSEKYDSLTRGQLIELLVKRERTKGLGLVWERDEIEADQAIDENFIACEILPELSYGPSPWDNMVIEGDNFDALRWLRMTLAGRVNCIYVDPPYNTGKKDWVYNDRYMDPEDRFKQSTWLEFLFRRFTLARDLLAEDGVMLISIKDNKRALVELLMNEALPGMNAGSIVWRTRVGGNEGGDHFLSINHESVLVFSKSEFRFAGMEKSFAMYKYYDEERQDHYRKSDLSVAVSYDSPRAGTAYYPLRDPETDIWYPCNPNRVWAYVSKHLSNEKTRIKTKYMEDWIAGGQVLFPEEQRVEVWDTVDELRAACARGDVPRSGATLMIREDLPGFEEWVGRKVGYGKPGFKRYKSDLRNPTQPLSSWVVPNSEGETLVEGENQIESGTNDEGAKQIREVFGSKAFDYPKPVSLVRELVRQSTGIGDIVLDFFAGSATTAQAVMELNAEDGGERRFIMVSSTEATGDQPDKNLCRDVTAERIKRLNESDAPEFAGLAAPIAYLRTGKIAFEDLDYDLEPKDAWAALETLHGLPLTVYDESAPWNAHEGEGVILVLVDRYDPEMVTWLRARARQNVFVYGWAPGQLARELEGEGIELRSVNDTLVRCFQQ